MFDLAAKGAALAIDALPALGDGNEARSLTQQWARAIYKDQPAGPGITGIHYRSGYNSGQALALWDCDADVEVVRDGTAINKTSHSTTHEFFRDYRFSCADAKSTSPQCLPANAASARKKHSPPDTAASCLHDVHAEQHQHPTDAEREHIRSTRVTNVLSAAGQRLTAAATSAALRTRSDCARFHNQRWC